MLLGPIFRTELLRTARRGRYYILRFDSAARKRPRPVAPGSVRARRVVAAVLGSVGPSAATTRSCGRSDILLRPTSLPSWC